MTIDVVIPTFDRRELLRDCLEHLSRQDPAHTAIVVDNGSSDGSGAMVRESFPSVRLVALKENLGFGAAVNLGAAAGNGEAIVVINNDVDVAPGFLAAVVGPLLRDPGIGMVSGVLLKPGGAVIDAAGLMIDGGLGGYAYLGGAPVQALDRPPGGLIGPCGGAAAYRRSAFDAVGGFDPEIFAYCEDVDIALRLLNAGWRCELAPDARGIHLGSATLGVRSLPQVRIASTSRGYLLGRYRVNPGWTLAALAIAVVDAVVLRSPAPMTACLRGLAHGLSRPRRPTPAHSRALGLRTAVGLRRRAAFG